MAILSSLLLSLQRRWLKKKKRRCEKNESLRWFEDLKEKEKPLFENLKPMVARNGSGERWFVVTFGEKRERSGA